MYGGMSRRIGAAALALPVLFGVVACSEEETAVEEFEDAEEGGMIIGETVTISGEVERRIGPDAFTMGGDETLVFGAEGTGVQEVGDDDVVEVTGVVREFLLRELERQFSIDFEEGQFIDFENELVVEASSVEVVEEG